MLFGTVPTSIPELILFGNWLLEGRFREKWQLLKNNRIFWALSLLFILHAVGMLYTSNAAQGIKDLRNKLPLEALPLVFFSTKAISAEEFRLLFGFFLLSVFVSSVCCFIVYLGYTKKVIHDVRDASVFMSHIRFSLFIAFAIMCAAYFFTKESKQIKWILGLLIAWLLFYLYKLEMATGFVCLCITVCVLVLVYSYRHANRFVSLGILLSLAAVLVFAGTMLYRSSSYFTSNPASPANRLLKRTYNGNPYLQDTLFGLAENGNLITININDNELRKDWNTRSRISYDSCDSKKNVLRYTILRYLASKGFTRDSVGLSHLTNNDIHNIELGVTNYKYPITSGIEARWRELVWEYNNQKRGKNPSGHTFAMRIEFWRTALYIVGKHPLIGVGTGDVQDAFNAAYVETGTALDANWRLRNHNQYLAIAVAFGLTGLLLFLFYLTYPAFVLRKYVHVLYWPFFIISLLSFVTEDTLETQSGVTFFIFFNAFFLWLGDARKRESII
ncbi:MAG: O-antigen ligase family protein [Bacteroidetes bacterium]|nr:O-antigen ligase family protein [Bacteroidota bacterium]